MPAQCAHRRRDRARSAAKADRAARGKGRGKGKGKKRNKVANGEDNSVEPGPAETGKEQGKGRKAQAKAKAKGKGRGKGRQGKGQGKPCEGKGDQEDAAGSKEEIKGQTRKRRNAQGVEEDQPVTKANKRKASAHTVGAGPRLEQHKILNSDSRVAGKSLVIYIIILELGEEERGSVTELLPDLDDFKAQTAL